MFKLLTQIEAVRQVEKEYWMLEKPEFIDWEATEEKQMPKVSFQILIMSVIMLYLLRKSGFNWITFAATSFLHSSGFVLAIVLLAQTLLLSRFMIVKFINKVIN